MKNMRIFRALMKPREKFKLSGNSVLDINDYMKVGYIYLDFFIYSLIIIPKELPMLYPKEAIGLFSITNTFGK